MFQMPLSVVGLIPLGARHAKNASSERKQHYGGSHEML